MTVNEWAYFILTVDAKDMSFDCGVAKFALGGSTGVLFACVVEPIDWHRVRFDPAVPAAVVSLAYWQSWPRRTQYPHDGRSLGHFTFLRLHAFG
jgi:hypothetical protein